MQVATLIQLTAAALGLVGLAAAAAAVARASHIKETLELLRGEVADLTASRARIEGEYRQLQQRAAHQDAEIRMLRELVTARADVEGLAREVRGLAEAERATSVAIMALLEGRMPWIRPPATGGLPRGSPPATD